MQRQNPRRMMLRFALSAAMLSLLILVPNRMSAQAAPARSREAGITTFVMYSRVNPDYDSAGNGVTVGGAYTRFFRFASPSVEVRYKYGRGRAVNESTFGGGLRVEHAISYFHPYADFMISKGTINFAQKSYIGSNGTGSNGSVVYSYGGGVDYDFADQWSARVDYQQESWNLNENPSLTLAPRALSIGILYRIRLHRNQYQ